MPKFSRLSQSRLATCDRRLQAVFCEVIKLTDCLIIEGHRSLERQAELFAQGKTKVRRGKHNAQPSLAVDVAPFPIDWNDRARFESFAIVVLNTADELGVELRWGGDWAMKWNRIDPRPAQKFDDLVHFELT